MHERVRSTLGAMSLGIIAICSGGCSDDGSAKVDSKPNNSDSAAVYALVTLVWGDEVPTGYVALTNSLDVKSASLDDAREFPGYTSVGVAEEQLLVNPSWEDLTIERYRITDDLAWKDAGALSFVNEGVEAVSFHTQYMQRDRAAYLDVDVTGRVIWDPRELSISSSRTDTILPLEQDGLQLYASFNRTQFVFGDQILRPFAYHDEDWVRWSSHSPVVVYDPESHEPSRVIDAPCPALDSITRAEDGSTYLGTWEYSALYPLMKAGAAPCVVKLTPDNEIDKSWNMDLTSRTEGRQVVNFRYIGDGKAIGAVFHAEEYGKEFDFPGLFENVDDFWATAARFHRLWFFDLDKQSAAPVTGIDDFEFVNPGFFHSVLDGRTFVFLGDGDSEEGFNFNKTLVYEIDARGRAERRFEMVGSVTQWVRLR